MKKRDLERKIKGMKPSEILYYMIEGLKNPFTQIRMNTFGEYDRIEPSKEVICYGCAATNALCKIINVESDQQFVNLISQQVINSNSEIISWFESCIDSLRRGDIDAVNLKISKFSEYRFPEIEESLPWLSNDYTKKEVKEYEKYMKLCIKQGV